MCFDLSLMPIPNLSLWQTISWLYEGTTNGEVLQTEIVNRMYERFLREFMDILIMVRMREGETSGYGILTYFHERFDFLVSSGTVYSMLYSMERDGLVKARGQDRRRIYSLTPKGEAVIEAVYQSSEVLENFFTDLLSGRTRVL